MVRGRRAGPMGQGFKDTRKAREKGENTHTGRIPPGQRYLTIFVVVIDDVGYGSRSVSPNTRN